MTDEFDVTVLVPAAPGAKEEEILEGVKVIRYHYFPVHQWETLCYPGAIVPRIKEKKVRGLLVPFLLISLWFHLWRLLPQFDLVHAHWLIPQGIVQSFFKKPYIVTGHGGDVTSLNKGILKRLKVRCLKRADQVMAVSGALKETIMELTEGAIREPHVISMGVDTGKFGRKYRIENYFGQGEKKVVLFVGRLAEKKGVTYLIEAMKKVEALLVIVGSGPLEKDLKAQAAEQGDKIQFIGAKTHEELKTVYASSDVFAMPSITATDGDREGLPVVALEAMASGLPVIASRSGGIEEVISDGENGMLCGEKNIGQLRECMNRLLKDRELYQKIIRRGEDTVKQYDYQYIAGCYKKCMGIGK